jgi:ribosomal protein S18 acetylase RimI-like enzyme
MARKPPIVREGDNLAEVSAELERRLGDFNEEWAGPLRTRPVVLTVRNAEGSLIAGLTAEIFWNALYVDVLWVDEKYRRQGHGASLLEQAEAIASAESCDVVYLSTFDFQAPGFYAKHGYAVIGELQGVPRGSTGRWFCKRLGKAAV